MADNTLTELALPADKDVIVTHPNQYFTALGGLHVPRSAGVPTDIAGDLGSSSYRWANAFIKDVFVGAVIEGVGLADNSGKLSFENNSAESTRISTTHRAVTTDGTDPGEAGFAISAVADFSTTTEGSWVDVTGYTVDLTVDGRPVEIFCLGDTGLAGKGFAQLEIDTNGSAAPASKLTSFFRVVRDVTNLDVMALAYQDQSATTVDTVNSRKFPISIIKALDLVPGTGTKTYKLQVFQSGTTTNRTLTTRLNGGRLCARELI